MKVSVSSILFSAAMAAFSVAASAQEVITNDTADIGGDFRLLAGRTWTVDYTVMPPDEFLLSLSFSGTGRRENLQLVTYGVNTADHPYQTYSGNPGASATATGLMDQIKISGPFSIVYHLSAAATRPVNVTYYGEVTSVPEIGAEGALPALLLVLGSIAVMTGARKRGQDLPLA